MISLARRLALAQEVAELFDGLETESEIDRDDRMGADRSFLHIARRSAIGGARLCADCRDPIDASLPWHVRCSVCRPAHRRRVNVARVSRQYWRRRSAEPCVYCRRPIDDHRTAGAGPSHPTCLDWARYAHELTHRAKRTAARHAAHAARPCADCGGPTGRTCGNARRCEPCATARALAKKRERALRYYREKGRLTRRKDS